MRPGGKRNRKPQLHPLREELFEDLELEKNIILIDLAVPRDIEPEVGRFEGRHFI